MQSPIAPTPIPPDATEEQLIGLWLHGKSPNTIRAYRRDIAAFRAFIGKPIRLAYLGDPQRYADALQGSPASCARRLLVVKSLLSFAARMGFTPFNIGAAIRPPRPDDRLAERILDERQVFALLDAVAGHPRDRALVRLLYNGGLRVSEAVSLQWRNLVDGANVASAACARSTRMQRRSTSPPYPALGLRRAAALPVRIDDEG
jgi:integrase/recombinase XerD